MNSNYPPGVTGNEYEIAGPDYERDVDEKCPTCGLTSLVERGYRRDAWWVCLECGWTDDVDRDEWRPRSIPNGYAESGYA